MHANSEAAASDKPSQDLDPPQDPRSWDGDIWTVSGEGGKATNKNGHGGFSYYNPSSVLLLLDSDSDVIHHSPSLNKAPNTWKHTGSGFVHIIPPLINELCHLNCSERGATCVTLNYEMTKKVCICPNGVVLGFLHAQCSDGK